MRESLSKFKAAGKKLFAFAESFGEFQNGLKDYYLASVCDRIFIPPSADVNIGKIVVNSPFIRNMLENKLSIRPEIYQRKAYKVKLDFEYFPFSKIIRQLLECS